MITKTMVCDQCGHEFASEYFEGGYIDHVVNFSSNAKYYLNSKSADQIAYAIVVHGNTLRNEYFIKTRLRCFKKWGASSDLYDEVAKKVEKVLYDLRNDKKAIDSALFKLTPSQKAILAKMIDQGALSKYYGAEIEMLEVYDED